MVCDCVMDIVSSTGDFDVGPGTHALGLTLTTTRPRLYHLIPHLPYSIRMQSIYTGDAPYIHTPVNDWSVAHFMLSAFDIGTGTHALRLNFSTTRPRFLPLGLTPTFAMAYLVLEDEGLTLNPNLCYGLFGS